MPAQKLGALQRQASAATEASDGDDLLAEVADPLALLQDAVDAVAGPPPAAPKGDQPASGSTPAETEPEGPIQRRQRPAPGVPLQRGPAPRRGRDRAAKRPWKARRKFERGGAERIRRQQQNEAARFLRRRDKIALAARMGAYRRRLRQGIQAFSGHPEGSYAHGRFLYLTDQLDTLGRRKNDLLDFNNASVEIDHSPHDASQRNGGLRRDGPALNYRVAVPLPRGWHRRHKTTHGPGAIRHDQNFSDAQGLLVENGRYHEALLNHLTDTLSGGAIGGTGSQKINVVLYHIGRAIKYATSDIPVSLHNHHNANTPLITVGQANTIVATLNVRVAALRISKGGVLNDITIA